MARLKDNTAADDELTPALITVLVEGYDAHFADKNALWEAILTPHAELQALARKHRGRLLEEAKRRGRDGLYYDVE